MLYGSRDKEPCSPEFSDSNDGVVVHLYLFGDDA